MTTIIESGLNIKAGDKFTTYQGRGIFTIKEVFDKSIPFVAPNSTKKPLVLN
jgi:hypothetical protein